MSDWKLRRLTPAERWLWVAVLAFARSSCVPGLLLVTENHALTDDELAKYADVHRRVVTTGLSKMVEFGMLEKDGDQGVWRVCNWEERQWESDDVRKRVATHRAKKEDGSNVTTPLLVTSNSVYVSVSDSKEEKQRAKDEEFEALCEVIGVDWHELTGPGRGSINNALKELKAAGVTADEIRQRASVWPSKFSVTLTAPALAKHWAQLRTTTRVKSPFTVNGE